MRLNFSGFYSQYAFSKMNLNVSVKFKLNCSNFKDILIMCLGFCFVLRDVLSLDKVPGTALNGGIRAHVSGLRSGQTGGHPSLCWGRRGNRLKQMYLLCGPGWKEWIVIGENQRQILGSWTSKDDFHRQVVGLRRPQVEGQRRGPSRKGSGVVSAPGAGQSEAESGDLEHQPEKAALDPRASQWPDNFDWSLK